MLQKLAVLHAFLELLVREEVVVTAVLLALARLARGGGDGQLKTGNCLQEALDQRPLSDPGGAGDDQGAGVYRPRYETSSLRCRSDRPPIVLLGEMRQCVRILLTFTRPYLGTASRRSNTLAVSRYSGGSSSIPWIWVRPALSSRLRRARRVRISLARLSASIRCASERSGARPADCPLGGDWGAAGMGGDHTYGGPRVEVQDAKNSRIRLDLDLSLSQ